MSTLPEIINGHIANGDSYENSSRNIYCNQGFRIDGSDIITCLSSGQWTTPGVCNTVVDGDLNLANQIQGSNGSVEGVLEIYHNGQWGAICHEGFEYLAARVACRQLGYSSEAAAFYPTTLTSDIPVVLKRVKCRGGESGLQHCDRDMYGMYECFDSKVVGLNCGGTAVSSISSRNEIRLTCSSVNGTGFLEVHNGNRWGAVCVDGLSPASASVACKQLGFSYSDAVVLPGANFSFMTLPKSPVSDLLGGVECQGNERTLSNCSFKVCKSVYEVAISCVGNEIANTSDTERFVIAIARNDNKEVDRLLELQISVNTTLERCCGDRINETGVYYPPTMICASCYGSYGVLKSLIIIGANINERYRNWTSLLLSASNGNSEMVKYLIDNGADFNARNDEQWTALLYAASQGSFELVKYLVENGADVNAKQNREWTVLMYASSVGTFEMVDYLVGNGADINAENLEQETALILATRHGPLEMVKYLVDNGANVNAIEINKLSPLMIAARYRTFEMVKYLVDNGADVNAKDNDHWNVLMFAIENGKLDMVRYLFEQGADVDGENNNDATVLNYALKYGTIEIIVYLFDKMNSTICGQC